MGDSKKRNEDGTKPMKTPKGTGRILTRDHRAARRAEIQRERTAAAVREAAARAKEATEAALRRNHQAANDQMADDLREEERRTFAV